MAASEFELSHGGQLHETEASQATLAVVVNRDALHLVRETKVARRVCIHLIEDEAIVREAGRNLFENAGYEVREYASAEAYLAGDDVLDEDCLVVDLNLPGLSGLVLLERLRAKNTIVPVIMLTGRRDAASAVAALKLGASDYIEKPADERLLLASVACAVVRTRGLRARADAQEAARARIRGLTPREHDVMKRVLAGMPSKNIAVDLGISQRTVESHRCQIMKKTGSRSIPQLVELCIEAADESDKGSDH